MKKKTGKKSTVNKLPKSQVKPEKTKPVRTLANSFNTYAPYQTVPIWYRQFGSNAWS